MAHLQISQLIPAPRFEVFDYLTNPENQPLLLKPAIDVEVFPSEAVMKRGGELHFNMTRMGFTQSVRLRIEDWLRGSRVTYRLVEGLFASWTHTMKFEEHGEKATLVSDLVDYRMGFGLLGYLADDLLVKRDMTHILESRLQKAKEHFADQGD